MKNFFLKPAILLAFLISLSGCSSDDSKSLIDDPNQTQCPQGYTGSGCIIQVQPKRIKITNIRVLSFPQTNNGSRWDNIIDGTADIYVKLYNSTNTVLFDSDFQKEAINQPYDFTPSSAINITDVKGIYTLEMLDYDYLDSISNDDDDSMGKIFFSIYSAVGGFPSSKTVSYGSFTYELSLQYEW